MLCVLCTARMAERWKRKLLSLLLMCSISRLSAQLSLEGLVWIRGFRLVDLFVYAGTSNPKHNKRATVVKARMRLEALSPSPRLSSDVSVPLRLHASFHSYILFCRCWSVAGVWERNPGYKGPHVIHSLLSLLWISESRGGSPKSSSLDPL